MRNEAQNRVSNYTHLEDLVFYFVCIIYCTQIRFLTFPSLPFRFHFVWNPNLMHSINNFFSFLLGKCEMSPSQFDCLWIQKAPIQVIDKNQSVYIYFEMLESIGKLLFWKRAPHMSITSTFFGFDIENMLERINQIEWKIKRRKQIFRHLLSFSPISMLLLFYSLS